LLIGTAVLTGLACGPAAAGANLLVNPGFDTPAPGVTPPAQTSFSMAGDGGLSAADSWRMWNNTVAQATDNLTTNLLPSTDPAGGGYMLHVTTAGAENGVYQFIPFEHPPQNTVTTVSVDVYVISGTFELGLGRDGTYVATAKTSTPDQWIRLTASTSPSTPGDEIFLYSTNGLGAEFNVDNAFAGGVPEPSTWTMLLAGFAGLGVAGARAARKIAA
jgi:hypothetical protein